jgi:hypothetical protein
MTTQVPQEAKAGSIVVHVPTITGSIAATPAPTWTC